LLVVEVCASTPSLGIFPFIGSKATTNNLDAKTLEEGFKPTASAAHQQFLLGSAFFTSFLKDSYEKRI
jgi:hypothetical protein